MYKLTDNSQIHTTTIADGVYSKLAAAIIRGDLRPGQRLVEADLARELQVSRTPLREAFKRLERERFLERLPQGGVRVSTLSAGELEQLMDVRSALEVLLTKKAAQSVRDGRHGEAGAAALQRMDEILADMRDALQNSNLDRLLDLGRAFHSAIHKLSGNRWGADMLSQVIDAMERYRARSPSARHAAALDEHQQLRNAVVGGNVDVAAKVMAEHMDRGREVQQERLTSLVRETANR
ncbi:MAG: GntR family transcriptional regulator [Trueperaceae bacterium]